MESLNDFIGWIKDFLKGQIPFTNPVLILSVVLLIILLAPAVFKRFRIPGIIGLIIAGIIIGPNTLHLIEKTTSFDLFSHTGLLYIMFLAGLEIDMHELKENRIRSLVFGGLTFSIPIVIGFSVCAYLFGFGFYASLLLASMLASHTLLSYPIVSSMGVIKNRAVQTTFGGTIIADTAALLLLGIIATAVESELTLAFWIKTLVFLAALVLSVLYLLPRVSRLFLRNIEGQGSSQYIYVLAVVFLSAFAAEVAGVEPIVGAFLAGLALNRVIPHNSVLMNRIVFIGNTLFIPFFLISSGMLVDLKMFFTGQYVLILSLSLSTVGLLVKFFAARITGWIYKFSRAESNIIFGLSAPHAAAALAITKVGHDIGLFDKSVVNSSILLILITCLVGSLVTEQAARKLAITEKDKDKQTSENKTERILVPVTSPENAQRLIELALLIKDPKSNEAIYPLTVVEDDTDAQSNIKNSKRLLDIITEQITSADKKAEILKKVDLNITDGIVRTAKAYSITDIVIGYHTNMHSSDFIFGSKAEQLITKAEQQAIVCKLLQPLNSFKSVIAILTPNAELEKNFRQTCHKINRILKQIGDNIILYGEEKTLNAFKAHIGSKTDSYYSYKTITSFENLDFIEHDGRTNELIIILNARKQTVSFDYHIDNLPKELHKTREYCSFLAIYPEASEITASNQYSDISSVTVTEQMEQLKKVTDKITGIFRKEGNENDH